MAEQSKKIRVEILGREHVAEERTEVKRGDVLEWFNTVKQECKVIFKDDGCPFGHHHKECEFVVPPEQQKTTDPIQGAFKKEYRFRVTFAEPTGNDVRGTPRIIVTG